MPTVHRLALMVAVVASVTFAVTGFVVREQPKDDAPRFGEYKVEMEDLDKPGKAWLLAYGDKLVVFPSKAVCEKAIATNDQIKAALDELRKRLPGRVGEPKCTPYEVPEASLEGWHRSA